ncbi:MAG: MarR family transcriptional regulator [Heliobacteriaceae bacterium]|jgi:DNA-binding MarR family transcriptional regulator|nr:MarR family transcriptional regulator [Heliobacteriaceae bacterium]
MVNYARNNYTSSVFYRIQVVARYCRATSLLFFENLTDEIAMDEFTILNILALNPQLCQRDLAKVIFKDRATTGRLLNSLEAKGFIARHADTRNNRLIRKMDITDKGEEILNKLQPIIDKATKLFETQFDPEEIEVVKKFLVKMRDYLKKNRKM